MDSTMMEVIELEAFILDTEGTAAVLATLTIYVAGAKCAGFRLSQV